MKSTTGSLPRGGAGDHTAGHHDNTSIKWSWQPFPLSGLWYRRNEVALLVGPGWESKSPQNKGKSPTISQLPPIVCAICTVTYFLLQRYCWDVCISLFYQKKSYMSCTEHPCCYCDKLNFHLGINESTVVQQQQKSFWHPKHSWYIRLRITLQSPRTTSSTAITHQPTVTFVALRLCKICGGGI